jgi:hypothetical protein
MENYSAYTWTKYGSNLHWYLSDYYKSGGVESKPFVRLNEQKRCGLISFIWGNSVEVRVKHPKIWDTSQEVHGRGEI